MQTAHELVEIWK